MNETTYTMWLHGDLDFTPEDIFLDFEDRGNPGALDDMSTQPPPLTWATAPEILTVEELAELLRLSYNAVNEAINNGEVPSQRIGRVKRIYRDAVISWLGEKGGAR